MFHAALFLTMAIQIQAGCSSDFFQNSWSLLKAARYGQTNYEQAAFAMRNVEGQVWFSRWPANSSHFLHADYVGRVPAGTLAIVHTHPNNKPAPSTDDAALARRLGIPVYVLTRTAIYRTTGHRTEIIAIGDWDPERCRKR